MYHPEGCQYDFQAINVDDMYRFRDDFCKINGGDLLALEWQYDLLYLEVLILPIYVGGAIQNYMHIDGLVFCSVAQMLKITSKQNTYS